MFRHLNLLKFVLSGCFLLSTAASSLAGDVNGTWTWKRNFGLGGEDTVITAVIKVEGEKLTGTVSMIPISMGARGGAAAAPAQPEAVEIKNGTFKNDEVSFETTRDTLGTAYTTKYTAKVDGDTLKGKYETTPPAAGGRGARGGGGAAAPADGPQDWEAKREKKVAAAEPNGTWGWSRNLGIGGETKITATIKVEGEKLTGTVAMPAINMGALGGDGGAAPPAELQSVEIKNGTYKNGELSFETSREILGTTYSTKYTGKVDGDEIKGKFESTPPAGGGRGGAGAAPAGPEDWTAKRETKAAAAPAGASAAGKWGWTRDLGLGAGETKLTAEIKIDGEKLTGTVSMPPVDLGALGGGGGGGGGAPEPVEIKNGTFKNGEVSFETSREVIGTTYNTKYTGKVDGDSIKGKFETTSAGGGAGGLGALGARGGAGAGGRGGAGRGGLGALGGARGGAGRGGAGRGAAGRGGAGRGAGGAGGFDIGALLGGRGGGGGGAGGFDIGALLGGGGLGGGAAQGPQDWEAKREK